MTTVAPTFSPTLPGLTLADVALPGTKTFWKDAALVVGGSLFTALMAQIAIPMIPVPVTGQTLAVLLCGAALGWKRGLAAQALYLAEISAGLPFMQGFSGGFAAMIASPTAGYLAAFPLAAGITGFLAQRGWDRKVLTTLLAMIIASLVIYAVGLLGLSRFLPAEKLLKAGMLPFLPGDALKIALAAILLPSAWKLAGKK